MSKTTDHTSRQRESTRGIYHSHSVFSYDGEKTLDEIADWARSHGLSFVVLTEHDAGFCEQKFQRYLAQCRGNDKITFIPGMEYSFRIDDREIHIGVVGIETFFDLPKTGMAIQPFLEAVRKQGGFSILHHPSRVIGDFGNETLQGFDFIEAWNLRHDIRYAPNRGIVAQAKRADFKGRFLASRDTHGFREKDRFPAIEMRREGTALSEKAILSSLAGGEYKLFTKGWDLRPDGTFKPRHRLFGFLPRLSLIHHNFYEMARRLYKRGVKVPPPKWLVKMMK